MLFHYSVMRIAEYCACGCPAIHLMCLRIAMLTIVGWDEASHQVCYTQRQTPTAKHY